MAPSMTARAAAGGAARPPCGERGSMLIVALGVLTLMSLLAATFWIIMSIERSAAANYLDQKKAQLIAEAAIQRVVEDVRRVAAEPLFDKATRTLQPFVFGRVGPEYKEIDPSFPVEKVERGQHPYFYEVLARSYSTGRSADAAQGLGVDEYRVKVIDASALFDLNFGEIIVDPGTVRPRRRQTLELMLEALGQALAARFGFDPIGEASFDGPAGLQRGAYAIVCYRATLDGRRFTSKSQLQEILSERAYRVLREYVTCHGWKDPKALQLIQTPGHTATERARGGRAQLNANLAPEEVLIAAIAPIAGRRFAFRLSEMLDVERQLMEFDPNAPPGQQQQRYFPPGTGSVDQVVTTAKEEVRFDPSRQGWVYVGPFGLDDARKIARWIIQQRPIRSYAHLHALISEMMYARQGALDDAMPRLEKGNVNVFPPQGGFPAGAQDDIAALTDPATSPPWFREFVRQAGYSLLLANFGTTFTPNTTNPNTASYLPVDKGSLLFPADTTAPDPRSDLWSRQTFDFCYDTRGIYEVTSLGQIRGKQGEILAQEKLFSVVQVMDRVILRSQAEFELNGRKYAEERFDVVTTPETQLFFAGPGAQRQDELPNELTVKEQPVPYGHVEVAPRRRYDDFDGSAFDLNDFLTGWPNFGVPTFAQIFESPVARLNAHLYLNAEVYDGRDIATTGSYDRSRGQAVPPFARAWGTAPAAAAQGWWVLSRSGPLFNDGLYTSYRRPWDQTLAYRAGYGNDPPSEYYDSQTNLPREWPRPPNDQGALGQENLSTRTAPPDEAQIAGNVRYRRGGIAFWYKPEYDWAYVDPNTGQLRATPLFCGLVATSRVWYNPLEPSGEYPPPTNPPPPEEPYGTPTDGTQLYVFRNTEGWLRATRIYFRAVGDPGDPNQDSPPLVFDPFPGDNYDGGTPNDSWFQAGQYVQGGGTAGAVELYREAARAIPYVPAGSAGQPGQGYKWPPDEFVLDGNIIYARTDAWVAFDESLLLSPLANWRANEWHHIAVYWDDGAAGGETNPNLVLKVYLDGIEVSHAYGMPYQPTTDMSKGMFCRINEPSTVQEGGVLKRYPRDVLWVGGIERRIAVEGSGVFKHRDTMSDDPKKIRLHACGTIDDVIVWDGNATPPASFNVPQRFQTEAVYTQEIDFSTRFPDGTQPIELATLSWEALLPQRFPRAGQPIVPQAGTGWVRLELVGTGTNVTYRSMQNDDATVPIVPQTGTGTVTLRPGELLKLRATLRATSFQQGARTYPALDTPALGEVSISYFLPFENTLLKERIID